ncbi:hypothetical protein PpBr36_07773 [Pyricularia pennisetigena]|uniref:hypothetical protein n=1 Tax=Pyricularia pennisetigena TaxID=1578925 RepID=UPI0011508BEC|nr:hypothetical protein PpBr36_07773 [Pyricularia pennisetigena]TLS25402.1 hypothetical protein PpBr36_07773 [Pyricularia pennisetigena]
MDLGLERRGPSSARPWMFGEEILLSLQTNSKTGLPIVWASIFDDMIAKEKVATLSGNVVYGNVLHRPLDGKVWFC